MKKFIAFVFALACSLACPMLNAHTLTLSQDCKEFGCVFGSSVLEDVDINHPMCRSGGITTWLGGQGEFALIGDCCSIELNASETFFISAAAKPGYRLEGWYCEGEKVSSNTWPILTPSQGGVVLAPTTSYVEGDIYREYDWMMSLSMPDRDIILTAKFVPEATAKLTIHLCSTTNKSVMVGASFKDKHGYVWHRSDANEILDYVINIRIDSSETSLLVPAGEYVKLFAFTGACSRMIGYFSDADFTYPILLENNLIRMPNKDIDIYVKVEDDPLYDNTQINEGDAAAFDVIAEWFYKYGSELAQEQQLEIVTKASEHCQQHPESLYCLAEILSQSKEVPNAIKCTIVDQAVTACVDCIRLANTQKQKLIAIDALYGLADLIRTVNKNVAVVPSVIIETSLERILYAIIDQQAMMAAPEYPTVFEALPELVNACSPISDRTKVLIVEAMINGLPNKEDSVSIMVSLRCSIGNISEELDREIYEWAVRTGMRNPNAAKDILSLVDELQITLSLEDKLLLLNSFFALSNGYDNSNYQDYGENNQSIAIVITNVVVHCVANSVQTEFVKPVSEDAGFVNVIAEVKGGNVAVPQTWAENYPGFAVKFGSDFTKALTAKSGKIAAGGREMLVWEDYVAGTDPTNPNDKFTASVTIVDGKPVISYTPELDSERAALRKYTTYGKVKLSDAEWTVVPEGEEATYNFFKVTVEMK